MAWVFYTGFAGGFLVGFFVAWIGKAKATQFAIIDGDKVLRGQLEESNKQASVARARVAKAKQALEAFPDDWENFR